MQSARQAFANFAAQAQKASAGGGGGLPGGGGGGIGPAIRVALGLGLTGYGVFHSVVTVQPGHSGVVYSRLSGLQNIATLREGINFVVPWLQRPVIFDIRTRAQAINQQTGSKDLQIVAISLRVLFRPDPQQLPFIYRRLGKDYDHRVLPSIVNEVTKAVVAQYNASELLTKREEVSAMIRNELMRRSSDFKLILEDVSVTNLAFSKEYTAAVEAKQVAQQDAERSKYIVEKAIQEKRTIIIRAEGEAASAELIGKSIADSPGFVQLRRIEAAKEVANNIVGSPNKVYLSSDTLMLNSLGDGAQSQDEKAQATAKKFRLW